MQFSEGSHPNAPGVTLIEGEPLRIRGKDWVVVGGSERGVSIEQDAPDGGAVVLDGEVTLKGYHFGIIEAMAGWALIRPLRPTEATKKKRARRRARRGRRG